ncbi:hypothetical protein NPIL_225101 [Nephila pilipes]|uniref:Uncharacterized protein n=1 Tax=Nephila pilipes TaxID=299642 RepID=A0A8X6NYV4_NEPPI|nr:hypothetical protein NPIL_225101 [Nephila pilipes]
MDVVAIKQSSERKKKERVMDQQTIFLGARKQHAYQYGIQVYQQTTALLPSQNPPPKTVSIIPFSRILHSMFKTLQSPSGTESVTPADAVAIKQSSVR